MIASTSTSLYNIIFLDIESTKQKKIQEFGIVYQDEKLKTSSLSEINNFIKDSNTHFMAGHNFINFDYEILKNTSLFLTIKDYFFIDTLPLSLLFFNEKTMHHLPKNYKNEDDFKNNPIEDSKLTRKLLKKIEVRFLSLDQDIQNIFYSLLRDEKYFQGFFKYIEPICNVTYLHNDQLNQKIIQIHQEVIVNHNLLHEVTKTNPIELAYILALLSPHIEIKSHPPKILYDFPKIVEIQKKLCFNFNKASASLNNFSKEVFGFGEFRIFPKLNPTLFGKSKISQQEIVEASLKNESFLTVLPTGGGKTFTFWLPAIIKAKSYKSLTVVISPLQALIEDHITSFNKNVANYKAIAISGFMSPLERAEAIEQTINGEADILYIAPESLRSNMIFNILKNRLIERFVIDEAHCLSTWGNDFRQDYYYICDYVKELVEAKPFQDHIPISCFTATAKPSVIEDIKNYFHSGLNLTLDDYIAVPERENLNYKSITSQSKDKYSKLLSLINAHDGSTLIYIPSSTKNCDDIAEKLSLDTDKRVKSFHSKIEPQEKMTILSEYIKDEIDIIVATTAFGMGVDKPNITNVIHYEMSDSLENYAQEAGRGARDKNLSAFCPILYDENDLDKHFASLNRSKITAGDINSIFRALKKIKGDVINKSAFELARNAGWDVEDNANDYVTKVKTALLELEREGYIERKRNKTHFYADSIAIDSINKLELNLKNSQYNEETKKRLILVHNAIIGRGKTEVVQVDELAHLLGYKKSEVAEAINQLKEMEILGDSKDLSLEIKRNSIEEFEATKKVELTLFKYLSESLADKVTIKELNEHISEYLNISKNNAELIKEIIRNWRDKSSFIFKRVNRQNDLWYFNFIEKETLKYTIDTRQIIAIRILNIFSLEINSTKKLHKIEFSLKMLREQTNKKFTAKEIDKTLLYLHHLHIVELLNGRFINYSPMAIHKKEKFSTKRKYTKTEYKHRLEQHYLTKIESIHIMGEYAKRLQSDNSKAIRFMRDYFTSPYQDFKKKYKLLKEKISRPITQHRYDKIFSKMSPVQQDIISDKHTKAMMVLAGPGSGKTKVLVHKIASLILTEDIKPEQFMMLTFSRAAMGEFKSRLNTLIGSLSFDIEINTFHSYALKLIARVVRNNDDDILNHSIIEATRQIKAGEITLPQITVLILDEFQDINEQSFELIRAIYAANDKEMRIIAVGDDDQCINIHAGADIQYIDKFERAFGEDDEGNKLFKQYELLTNFRSKNSIVEYSNSFISKITQRYKTKLLKAYTQNEGKVTVQTCRSKNLITPVVELIKKEEQSKNIAILAYTNDEIMQIYSNLQEIGIAAKFIIDREKFHLKNIIEIVEFDKIVNSFLHANTVYSEENFEKALEIIELKYQGSKNIQLLKKVVDKFLYESQAYYASTWLAYLDEIKIEEFEEYNKDIVLSTIHKSKGMEFDKVILLVKENPKKDIEKRIYYVGMTRAKNELTILRHGSDKFEKKEYAHYIFDSNTYLNNHKIQTFMMGLNEIYLGYNYQKYYDELKLVAGTQVTIGEDNYGKLCIKYQNKVISIFSQAFNQKISHFLNNGYKINNAEIDYIIVWYDRQNSQYIQHPLYKIVLHKLI